MMVTYYLIKVEGCVEPFVRGPYRTTHERDEAAKLIHKNLEEDDALFWANTDKIGRLIVGSYPSRFYCRKDQNGDS